MRPSSRRHWWALRICVWLTGSVVLPFAIIFLAVAFEDTWRLPRGFEWENAEIAMLFGLFYWAVIVALSFTRQSIRIYAWTSAVGLLGYSVILFFAHVESIRDPWSFGVMAAYPSVYCIAYAFVLSGITFWQYMKQDPALSRGLCSECGYEIAGLGSDRCPECGAATHCR